MKLSQLKELIYKLSESELEYLELIGIDINLWNIYRESLASIESAGSGNYKALGGYQNNYDGRYQLGSSAKKDAARILGIDYLGDDQISRYLFRNNPQLQEDFLIGFTYANHSYLFYENSMYRDLSLNKKLEVLIYAHNQGWRGALDWLENGSLHVDSFGTEAIIYVEKLNENIGNNDFEVLSNEKNIEYDGDKFLLSYIKDFDGNLHGRKGVIPEEIRNNYKFQGYLDINSDLEKELIFTNKESGRWVSIKVDPTVMQIDYSDHGNGGGTRVVGIYEDPLIVEGSNNGGFLSDGVTPAPANFGVSEEERYVEVSGETIDRLALNSQVRFQNDLDIDNLSAKHSGDYDSDGVSEVYWKTNDGTAYLRALMHADGNIRYANYQSEAQMKEYLTMNGDDSVITDITS